MDNIFNNILPLNKDKEEIPEEEKIILDIIRIVLEDSISLDGDTSIIGGEGSDDDVYNSNININIFIGRLIFILGANNIEDFGDDYSEEKTGNKDKFPEFG